MMPLLGGQAVEVLVRASAARSRPLYAVDRKGEGKGRPLAGLAALDREAAAVRLGQLAADVESQPRAPDVTEVRLVAAVEALEDSLPQLDRNAHAVVRDSC